MNPIKLITAFIGSLLFLFAYEAGIMIYWAASTEVFDTQSLIGYHITGWHMSIVKLLLIMTGLRFLWLLFYPDGKFIGTVGGGELGANPGGL